LKISYPEINYYIRPHFVIVSQNEPFSTLPTVSLPAPPFRSVLLISEKTGDRDKIIEEVKRLSPIGIDDCQVIITGNFPTDYINKFIEEGLNVKLIDCKDPVQFSIEIDKFKDNLLDKKSKNILIADESDLKSLLPGTGMYSASPGIPPTAFPPHTPVSKTWGKTRGGG